MMNENDRQRAEQASRADTDRIFNLPNMLSFFRLALIPVIVYCYEAREYYWAVSLLVLSGLTDVVDGWIARTFHLVTDFGKAIDPVADKLTQIAVMLCLLPTKYWWVVAVLVCKELTIGVMTILVRQRTGNVYSAGWYGKLCTVIIYLSMFILMLWREPAPLFVLIDSIVIAGAIVLAFAKYFLYFTRILREARVRDTGRS